MRCRGLGFYRKEEESCAAQASPGGPSFQWTLQFSQCKPSSSASPHSDGQAVELVCIGKIFKITDFRESTQKVANPLRRGPKWVALAVPGMRERSLRVGHRWGSLQRCPTRGLNHSVKKGQFEKRRTYLTRQMPVSLTQHWLGPGEKKERSSPPTPNKEKKDKELYKRPLLETPEFCGFLEGTMSASTFSVAWAGLGREMAARSCKKLQGCRTAGLSAFSPSASSGALEPQDLLQHSCWLFTECTTVAHDSQGRQMFARAPQR